jgi:hypothetical protein
MIRLSFFFAFFFTCAYSNCKQMDLLIHFYLPEDIYFYAQNKNINGRLTLFLDKNIDEKNFDEVYYFKAEGICLGNYADSETESENDSLKIKNIDFQMRISYNEDSTILNYDKQIHYLVLSCGSFSYSVDGNDECEKYIYESKGYLTEYNPNIQTKQQKIVVSIPNNKLLRLIKKADHVLELNNKKIEKEYIKKYGLIDNNVEYKNSIEIKIKSKSIIINAL